MGEELGGGGGGDAGDEMDQEAVDREIEPGLKRARDEDEREDMEVQRELQMLELLIASVSGSCPPWYDTVSGLPLDEHLVDEGMDRERASLKNFDTYGEVDEKEPAQKGQRIIRSGWVLGDRGDRVKARLVAQEVN